MNFNSSTEWQLKAAPRAHSNQGNIVFFIVNVNEIFGVTLGYTGIKKALNAAFTESKKYIPIDTGLMRSSYTMQQLSDNSVIIYFDPSKILGKTRKNRIVDTYYPMYLAEKAKTFNWLTIVMSHFYNKLFDETRRLLSVKEDNTGNRLDLDVFGQFMENLNNEYKRKLEEARKVKGGKSK